jgi:hypothetical protein
LFRLSRLPVTVLFSIAAAGLVYPDGRQGHVLGGRCVTSPVYAKPPGAFPA